MQYRHFGKLDVKPSLLGFGAMRMPILDGDTSKINEPEAIKMIRASIDGGVNYVDTAYPYHGGKSEFTVAKALKDGYRQKVSLASKNPTWLLEKQGDFTKYLDEQLGKLEVDCIDFYLQHSFDGDRWNTFKKLNVYEEAMKAKADGKIKYFGFSFHAEYEVFEEIINSYDWDFCQIQYNFLDENYQAGMKGLKLAASKNIGVIVMEPLRGGRLADKMPEDLIAEYDQAKVKRNNVDWALRWVANQPEVSLLLSGMNTMEQVEENLKICSADDIVPGKALNAEESAMIKHIADTWNKRILVGCTACNYCMPCPAGVNIPECFAAYNLFGSAAASAVSASKKQYKELKENGAGADKCIECRACVSQCPQSINIPEKLAELDKVLS